MGTLNFSEFLQFCLYRRWTVTPVIHNLQKIPQIEGISFLFDLKFKFSIKNLTKQKRADSLCFILHQILIKWKDKFQTSLIKYPVAFPKQIESPAPTWSMAYLLPEAVFWRIQIWSPRSCLEQIQMHTTQNLYCIKKLLCDRSLCSGKNSHPVSIFSRIHSSKEKDFTSANNVTFSTIDQQAM